MAGHLTAAMLIVAPLVHGSQADQAQADAEEIVTVVATRTERSLNEVAATVSVATAAEIEKQLARDIADLARFEPGVSVGGTGSRFGLSGFSIRGIGGNRVLTLIDGVRVPDEFSFGPFLSARRDFVDIDSLSRAEIARGPISSLYGSDALGGVVALQTKTPQDYLGAPGESGGHRLGGGFKSGYSSADDSVVGTLNLALGIQPFSGLIAYTRRAGAETDNMGRGGGTGPLREQPDPQQARLDNVVVKIAFDAADHAITLGVDQYGNQTDTRILSDYDSVSRGTTVQQRDADDSRDRQRFSLGYRYRGALPFATDIQATLYSQRSETQQLTFERRTTRTRAAQTRRRESFYQQEVRGANAQFHKPFAFGDSSHYLIYGVDYTVTNSASRRDGGTFDAAGRPMREFTRLPTRDFPPTEVTQWAVFVQDEIALLDDKLLLSPGVRLDDFSAKVAADPLYLAGNPVPEDYADTMLSAKLGALYSFTERLSAYVRYSEGYRAPPYDDVNVGFSNFLGGYKTISNPHLESERSRGVELGVRLRRGAGHVSLAAFGNRYTNFIESFATAPQFLASGGIDPADGLRTFQSVNRTAVAIDGVELDGGFDLGGGWSMRVAAAYARGKDSSTGAPLNSIEPLSAVLGIGYEEHERWGVHAIWTLARGKDTADIDSADPLPPTSGHGIVDVLAHARFGKRVQVDVGLFNMGDKAYLRWVDSAAIGTDAPLRFTQPGFNFGATLRVDL